QGNTLPDHLRRADALLGQQKYGEAADKLVRLEQLHPGDLDVLHRLVVASAHANLRMAGPICRRMLRLAPGEAWVRFFHGGSHMMRGRLALAQREFQACEGFLE